MSTPKASSTSAAPDLLETLLFPCFATLQPAAAATIADVVEMLKVNASSPPVPTISSTSILCSSFIPLFLIPIAEPDISSIVSPFILSATRYELINSFGVSPLIISFITFSTVSYDKSSPFTNLFIASLIILILLFLLFFILLKMYLLLY